MAIDRTQRRLSTAAWVAPCALIAVTLLTAWVYAPGLSGPLLLDDTHAIVANGLLKIDGTVFDEWRSASLSSQAGPLRRPVAMFTFAANHAFAGKVDSVQLKAVNLVLHLAIGGLIYLFFRDLLGALGATGPYSRADARLIAWFASAIWLTHPLHVSTVLYAVQRMALLSTLFVVLGLWVFIRYRREWALRGAGVGDLLGFAAWTLLIALFAVYSKENGILLLWLLPVVEVTIFRGVWRGTPSRPLVWAGWLLLLAPVMLLLCILTFSPDLILAGFKSREFSPVERILTQSRLLWQYLAWICVPDLSSMGFQHDDFPLSRSLLQPLTTIVSIIAWFGLILVALAMRHRYPLLLFATLFYLVAHSMESSIYPLEMVYEHRNYLPSAGISLLLAALVVDLCRKSEKIHVLLPVGGVLVFLLASTAIRAYTWSDPVILSRTNVVNHPHSSRSNFFYAYALFERASQQDSGISDNERDELLLLSRHYYERMHQEDPEAFGPLIMLYYLDRTHYTEMLDYRDWLGELEDLVTHRRLQVSDRLALPLLLNCAGEGACKADSARVTRFLDQLVARYPASASLIRMQYKYLSLQGASQSRLLELLAAARDSRSYYTPIYSDMITEYSKLGDVGGMYDTVSRWMLHDPRRIELTRIKSLFYNPAAQ